jgi:diaminopropionate ammonia-lyase
MMNQIEIISNSCAKTDCTAPLQLMEAAEMKKAQAFHSSFPQYEQTPLIRLDGLANKLGVKGIYIKDESFRFGLNAFKVLGGSYAIAKYIAKLTNCDISAMTYERLISQELRDKIGQITFFTATDGNHGRGVAWAANKLGQQAVVFMPAGSSQTRLNNIKAEGAQASIIAGNYDDAVRLAVAESAKIPNSVVIQDTAWEGYEEIPGWIMQGYGTMAAETDQQLQELDAAVTHIFVQAGVGSLAGAVQGYFTAAYGSAGPTVTVVEPHAANCLFQSAKAMDYQVVGGAMATIMAGLACGEPNTISWELLKNNTSFFASCPDWVAAKGMRVLASPRRGDRQVVSGESGAVGAGLLATLMTDGNYHKMRQQMGLNEDSVVLLFSTEGDTDPQKYQDIVWDGAYHSMAGV